jgi:type II secretory pathway component PulK
MRRRRGFALLLVLWMLVGVAAIGLGLVSTGRSTVASSTNRVLLARGAWRAEGCLARARAVIDDTLRSSIDVADAAWRSVDSVIALSQLVAGCDLEAHPAGVALDVNEATAEQLTLVLQSMGVRAEHADSIADAILDWEDPDDTPRLAGAESAWYSEHGEPPPRNGPIAARNELSLVRGVRSVSGIDSLFDVEPGRIVISRAPLAVLAALPGFGPEAVARASALGAVAPRDLLEFSTLLSPAARAELLAQFQTLQKLVTFSPDAWIITSYASAGSPAVMSTIEVRLVRSGPRAAVVRRRSWP